MALTKIAERGRKAADQPVSITQSDYRQEVSLCLKGSTSSRRPLAPARPDSRPAAIRLGMPGRLPALQRAWL